MEDPSAFQALPASAGGLSAELADELLHLLRSTGLASDRRRAQPKRIRAWLLRIPGRFAKAGHQMQLYFHRPGGLLEAVLDRIARFRTPLSPRAARAVAPCSVAFWSKGRSPIDPAQVNLSAFELWFSENRPFFVEGADLFRLGSGSWLAPDMFYSRRIGAAPQGRVPSGAVTQARLEPVPIMGAGKLSGRTGGGWSPGFMAAATERAEARYQGSDGTFETATLGLRRTG